MSSTPYFMPNSYLGAPARWTFIVQAWLPVLLLSGVFVLESSAAFGADHTSRPLHTLLHGVVGSSLDHNWSLAHHILRKVGHFGGYGVFALICYRGFRMTLHQSFRALRDGLGSHALAVSVTFLVASADEIHQTFLPNRTGSFSDVMLDTAGAAAFQLLLFMVLRLEGRVSWKRWRLNSKRSMRPLQSAILPGL
jgi:VanZ family protein